MSERDAWIEKAEARLKQWRAKADEAEGQVKEKSADAKIEGEKQTKAVRKQLDEFSGELKKARESSSEAWTEAKPSLERAYEKLEDAVNKMFSR